MFLPPSNQPNIAPASNPVVEDRGQKITQKTRIMKALSKWSAYGFFFCIGVTAAHISRLIPNSLILYLAFVGAAGGYLFFIKPEGAGEDLLSLRRLCGLALCCSALVWWDAIVQAAFLPVSLFGLIILPLWKLAMMLGMLALLVFGVTLMVKQ